MSRPRDEDAPFPLFSFMDIITSVIGIIFLIAILMALDVLDRRQSSAPDASDLPRVVVEPLPDEEALLRKLEEAKALLEQELGELEKDRSLAAPARLDHDALSVAMDEAEKLKEEGQRLQAELKDAEAQLEARLAQEAERRRRLIRSRRIVSLPGEGASKIVALVECGDDGVKSVILRPGMKMRTWKGGSPPGFRDFRRWAESLESKGEHDFLVYVAADRMKASMEIVEWLGKQGFHGVGYEPLPRGLTAVFDMDPEE